MDKSKVACFSVFIETLMNFVYIAMCSEGCLKMLQFVS